MNDEFQVDKYETQTLLPKYASCEPNSDLIQTFFFRNDKCLYFLSKDVQVRAKALYSFTSGTNTTKKTKIPHQR